MRRHSTAGEAQPLTKADIKALKTANALVVRYVEGGPITPAVSRFECIKRPDDTDPWEQRHEIQVATRIECYEKGRKVEKACDSFSVYDWEQESHYNTFFSMLKEGDTLTMKIVAANNSDVLNERQLYCDQLYFIINRGEKKKLCFLIDSTTRLDNSARMCQMRPAREGEW